MKKIFGIKRPAFILSLLILSISLAPLGCRGKKGTENAELLLPAQIAVSSREIANGNVVLNNVLDQTITVRNAGGGNVALGTIAQADPLDLPFSIVNDYCSGRVLQASGKCTLQVRFKPTAQGSFHDSFDIPSDAPNEKSVNVAVSGSGKALRVIINQVKTDQCGQGMLDLLVTVMDKSNTAKTGLSTANFQLAENGQSKAIASVTPIEQTAAISVATVLDYTASLKLEIPQVEAASRSFIELIAPTDEAAIIKFAQKSQLMQDFTTDKTVLLAAIDADPLLIGSRDETHLFDTLWFAVETTAPRANNRAIVLISDGRDENNTGVPNVSEKSLSDVTRHAVEKNVAIYTIGLGNVDGGVMNQLAADTGGQYFYAPASSDLSGIYQAIRSLLAGQYSVQYGTSLSGSKSLLLDLGVVIGSDEGQASRQAVSCP